MAVIFDQNAPRRDDGGRDEAGYARRMSSHLAAALLLFTLLQIAIVVRMGAAPGLRLGIIVATGGFAIAARAVERRWTAVAESGLPQASLAPRFRRNLWRLWTASLLGALLWIPLALLLRALSG